MREDFWQFQPTHKILLATNHRPQITGTDLAIWRRIKLVPFTVTIPENQQDKQLVEKLEAELPGILAWAVRGCLAWQKDGLKTPDEVTKTTAQYRSDMDDISKFIAEMCIVAPHAKVMSSVLYKTFLAWGGDPDMTQKAFTMSMVEHGYAPPKRLNTGMFWHGIGLPGAADDRDK